MQYFRGLKAELAPDAPGFRVLCHTRWTVRTHSFKSVLYNYTVLMSVWDETVEGRPDPDIRSRVIGVSSQKQSFDFFLGGGVCVFH